MLAFKIQIPKRNTHCCSCCVVFKGGQEYLSLLSDEGEEGAYTRRDFCLACKHTSDARISWKGKVPERPSFEDRSKTKHERALSLLHVSLQEKGQEGKAFLLALYLQRQKVLKRRHSTTTDHLFEVSSTEEMLAVPIVSLDALPLAEIQREIADALR